MYLASEDFKMVGKSMSGDLKRRDDSTYYKTQRYFSKPLFTGVEDIKGKNFITSFRTRVWR